MRVGFTGTRGGMSDPQRRAFIAWAKSSGATEFHHGCCVGADEEAWDVMASGPDLGFPRPRVVAHPPANRSAVCATAEALADDRRPPADYLARNRAIVDACDLLVACPKGPEEARSGTWATVRYARKAGRRVTTIWPDGRITNEG